MTIANNNRYRESFNFYYVIRFSLPILWAAIICWLSLISNPSQITNILGWDKLRHAMAYALLTVLVAQYLQMHFPGSWKAVFYATCFAIMYGGLMEILQLSLQTGRVAEWADLLADMIGAFTGCVIFRQAVVVVSRHQPRNEPNG